MRFLSKASGRTSLSPTKKAYVALDSVKKTRIIRLHKIETSPACVGRSWHTSHKELGSEKAKHDDRILQDIRRRRLVAAEWRRPA